MKLDAIFCEILSVQVPDLTSNRSDGANPAFDVKYTANGAIPFAQVVVWCDGQGHVIPAVRCDENPHTYVARVPESLTRARRFTLQVEGCQRADIDAARAEDWIKRWLDVEVRRGPVECTRISGGTLQARLYFGIHKHMHQPYYRAAQPEYWDGRNRRDLRHAAGRLLRLHR